MTISFLVCKICHELQMSEDKIVTFVKSRGNIGAYSYEQWSSSQNNWGGN